MKKTTTCLILLIIAAAAPSTAADKGFFVGFGIGRSGLEARDFYPELAELSVSEQNTCWKAFGGYRFMDYLAVEAGYANLGSPQSLEAVVFHHPWTVDVSVKGWDVFAVGLLPINKVDLFAKIGVIGWDYEGRASQDAELIDTRTDSGTDTAYGVGLSITLGKLVSLRGEVEVFSIGDYQDVPMWTVGLSFRF